MVEHWLESFDHKAQSKMRNNTKVRAVNKLLDPFTLVFTCYCVKVYVFIYVKKNTHKQLGNKIRLYQ